MLEPTVNAVSTVRLVNWPFAQVNAALPTTPVLSVRGRRLPNEPVPADVIFPKNEPVKEPVNGAVSELNCVELLITPSVFNSFFTPSRKCTELVFNVIVPALVIVPPDNPSPAVMDVTVPAPPGAQLADTANDEVVE